jgi:hypothetical protein
VEMLSAKRETEIYREDAKHNHNLLTPAEREKLLEVTKIPDSMEDYANYL